MSASDRGTLEKLLILAYTTPDYSGEPASQFTSCLLYTSRCV